MKAEDHLLDDLFREYGNRVLRFAYSYTNDYYTAEDICQETFIRFRMHQDEVSPGSEKKWLLTVAKNLSIDWLRKGGHFQTEVGISDEVEGYLTQNLDTDLSDLMVLKEAHEVLRSTIQSMETEKPELYEVLHLSMLGNMDNTSIGERLNIRADLVSKRKERARSWMKKRYTEELGD